MTTHSEHIDIGRFVRIMRGSFAGMTGVVLARNNGMWRVRMTAHGAERLFFSAELRREKRTSEIAAQRGRAS